MSDSTPHPMDTWLPHRGRMRLIERVERCEGDAIACSTRVRPDGLFVEADGLPAWIGIELMAQAAAAWAGARARASGGAPRVGYLVAVRRYDAQVPTFPVGATLDVSAVCTAAGDNGLRVFDCAIALDGRELASGRVSVFEAAPQQGD